MMRAPAHHDDILHRAIAPLSADHHHNFDKDMMLMLLFSKILDGEIIFKPRDPRYIQAFIDVHDRAMYRMQAPDDNAMQDMERQSWARFIGRIARSNLLQRQIEGVIRSGYIKGTYPHLYEPMIQAYKAVFGLEDDDLPSGPRKKPPYQHDRKIDGSDFRPRL